MLEFYVNGQSMKMFSPVIAAASHLNLIAGAWEAYLTAVNGANRLTSTVVIFDVKESGLVDAPLHQIPQSIAEQIQATASTALTMAQTVKNAADSGA